MNLWRLSAIQPVYQHLYVSPHLDDVALSCAGRILRDRARGERVLVVTVFAGLPAPDAALTAFARFQHRRWGDEVRPYQRRRREDARAMGRLGVDYLWLDFPDAIYRDALYTSDEALFGAVAPADAPLARQVTETLAALWARTPGARVYLPLAVRRHVDHQICWQAAAGLQQAGACVVFYEDYPYAAEPDLLAARLAEVGRALQPEVVEIGPYLAEKTAIIALYRSQMPTLFGTVERLRGHLQAYARAVGAAMGGLGERYWWPEVSAGRTAG